jgi:2'-5' RNA ligase
MTDLRGGLKTHITAVVLIPPEQLWAPIQAIRERHDRNIGRWMPHITMLYPFWPWAQLHRAEPRLHEVVAATEPFTVTLARFRFFYHRHARYTMWLEPEPPEPVIDLHRRLHRRFPGCDDTARFRSGFTPHLSVGQISGQAKLHRRLSRLQASWQPIEWTVDTVSLIYRAGHTPFQVYEAFKLGRGSVELEDEDPTDLLGQVAGASG